MIAARRASCLTLLWMLRIGSVLGAESTIQGTGVDYPKQIQPILKAHCWKCHGPEKQEGGLRLDQREFAAKGGRSGKPILTGSRPENELLRRVVATVEEGRMPPEGDPLAELHTALLESWISAGARFEGPPLTWGEWVNRGFWQCVDPTLSALERGVEQYRWELTYLLPILIVCLLIERAKLQLRRGLPVTRGKARWLYRVANFVPSTTFVIGAMAVVIWSFRQTNLEQTTQIQQLQAENTELKFGPTAEKLFGSPPTPLRPKHPKRLRGSYYRGNDERNTAIFNGGVYRTCTFELALCHADRTPMQYGDRLQGEQGWVHLKVIRSPFTTPALFTDDLFGSTVLTKTVRGAKEPADEPARFTVLKSTQEWECWYPLTFPANDDQHKHEGLIYVQKETPHYAIKYVLVLEDGAISRESEIWMGSLLLLPSIEMPRPGRIPLEEWFNHLPIPEITEENTTDPVLLGIPEHKDKDGKLRAKPATDRP